MGSKEYQKRMLEKRGLITVTMPQAREANNNHMKFTYLPRPGDVCSHQLTEKPEMENESASDIPGVPSELPSKKISSVITLSELQENFSVAIGIPLELPSKKISPSLAKAPAAAASPKYVSALTALVNKLRAQNLMIRMASRPPKEPRPFQSAFTFE